MSFCIRKGYNGPKAKSLDHMAREQLSFILVFEHGWKLTKWTTCRQTLAKKILGGGDTQNPIYTRNFSFLTLII